MLVFDLNVGFFVRSCIVSQLKRSTGVKLEEVRRGRIGGFGGYLEGIFGNPSFAKIQEKSNKNLRTT